MIKTFRHKGLQKFYNKGDFSKIKPEDRKKIRLILTIITAAKEIHDINRLIRALLKERRVDMPVDAGRSHVLALDPERLQTLGLHLVKDGKARVGETLSQSLKVGARFVKGRGFVPCQSIRIGVVASFIGHRAYFHLLFCEQRQIAAQSSGR